jgi:hypothetical protein
MSDLPGSDEGDRPAMKILAGESAYPVHMSLPTPAS